MLRPVTSSAPRQTDAGAEVAGIEAIVMEVAPYDWDGMARLPLLYS